MHVQLDAKVYEQFHGVETKARNTYFIVEDKVFVRPVSAHSVLQCFSCVVALHCVELEVGTRVDASQRTNCIETNIRRHYIYLYKILSFVLSIKICLFSNKI